MRTQTEMLVDKSWATISAAVEEGLAEPDDASLDQVGVLVKRSADLRNHVQLSWGAAGPGDFAAAELNAVTGNVYRLSATFCIPVILLTPRMIHIYNLTEWARSVRARELRWVLGRLVSVSGAAAPELSSNTEMPERSHLIVFQAVENLQTWARLRGADFTVLSGLGNREGLPAAIIVPPDTVAISRLEPFELSWDTYCTCNPPHTERHVTFVLTERIKLVNMPEPGTALTFDAVGTFPAPAPSA